MCHVPGYENQVVGHSKPVIQIKDQWQRRTTQDLQVTVQKKCLQVQKSITKNIKLNH